LNQKFYIIAGEASGDLHGSNLIKAIQKESPSASFRCWGGDEMEKVAGKPVKHIKELAFMGFIEVVMNIRTILNNISYCKKDIENYQPDALILIDYPGFNMRIAKWAKQKGIRVIYYISPQIWAWKQKRGHELKKSVDQMIVILPFEKEFYKRFDMDVDFVGHPLLDAIDNFKDKYKSDELKNKYALNEKPILAILPGSRKQEISKKLPIMLEAAKKFNSHHLVVAGAPSQESSFYESIILKYIDLDIQLISGATYEILSIANLAMVTSGTATLETALFRVPQVVCYKGSPISYIIAKNLVKIDYISLVNLIMNKEVVKELIQQECTPKNIEKELLLLLDGKEKRKLQLKNYESLIEKLGDGGASQRAAQKILKGMNLSKS
jgi:lipid-A-disaccharide synthase